MTVSLKKSQNHFLRTPTCRENNTGTYKYSLLRTMSESQPIKRTATSCQVTLPKVCSWSNIFVSSRRCLRLFIRSPSALQLLVCSSVLSANEDSDFQKGQDDKKRRKLWEAWYSLWDRHHRGVYVLELRTIQQKLYEPLLAYSSSLQHSEESNTFGACRVILVFP